MTLDSSRPVYVKKNIPFGSGSVIFPSDRPYRLDQIPDKYQTEDYLRQEDPKKDKFREYANPVKSIPVVSPSVVAEDFSRLNINTATKDQFMGLPSIGDVISNKLIEERTRQPFSSFDDLNTRVPLKGIKWESMSDLIRI